MNVRMSRVLRAPGWRHAIGEIAFIVVGVLIALAMNAWWQGRQDRKRERTELVQLLEASRENRRRLQEAIAVDSLSGARALMVHWQLQNSENLPAPDSMIMWSVTSMWFSDVHPVTGPFQAIIQSGALQLITNSRLRGHIVEYSGELDGTLEQLREHDALSMRLMTDFRDVPGMYRTYVRYTNQFDGTPANRRLPVDPRDWRNDASFKAHLIAISLSQQARSSLLRPLLAKTAALQQALTTELGADTVQRNR